MPSSSAISDSSLRRHTYSRKQKSLGLLCTNFLSLYNRDGVHLVGLDDAASQLGVERRRIYDIVNVLESVGVLARKAKNQYTWKGFGAIHGALEELKEEGLRENCNTFDRGYDNSKVSDDEDDEETLSNPSTGSQNDKSNPSSAALKSLKNGERLDIVPEFLPISVDNRREKSLALLTQNFVKLFICSSVEMISLDEAARFLLGDAHNASIMRTKVRRLYDIANVLSSMNLIEKIHMTDTRKPAFRWLGMKGKVEDESAFNPNLNESRKRMFGTDVTNITFKRNKLDIFIDGNSSKNLKMQNSEDGTCLHQADRNNSKVETKQSSKSYQFGPFAPVSVPKVRESNSVKRLHDWDNLASSCRPRYQNQALKDLFSHYMEAWKSWYSEVAEKKPKQIL